MTDDEAALTDDEDEDEVEDEDGDGDGDVDENEGASGSALAPTLPALPLPGARRRSMQESGTKTRKPTTSGASLSAWWRCSVPVPVPPPPPPSLPRRITPSQSCLGVGV